jgi:hypothetical protein
MTNRMNNLRILFGSMENPIMKLRVRNVPRNNANEVASRKLRFLESRPSRIKKANQGIVNKRKQKTVVAASGARIFAKVASLVGSRRMLIIMSIQPMQIPTITPIVMAVVVE